MVMAIVFFFMCSSYRFISIMINLLLVEKEDYVQKAANEVSEETKMEVHKKLRKKYKIKDTPAIRLGLLYIPIGTPIIAVESGYVEAIGWNQYGGWRIGIRSFDGKRYYYYAHLRQNYPYREQLKEGDVVTAGDVIGYWGIPGTARRKMSTT